MDRKTFLEALKGRARLLFSSAQKSLNAFITKAEENLGDEAKAKESAKKMSELQKAALDDRAKMKELNAIRIIQVQNFVYAMSNAINFFDTVSLANDEEPVIENTQPFLLKARMIGEDGKPHMIQVQRTGSRKPIELSWMATRQIEYPLVDVYRGEIGGQILATLDLARAITRKIDTQLWPLIKALCGTFNTTATKLGDRTFVLEEGVDINNIPKTNNIVLADNSTTSRFRLAVIIAAIDYCAAWGNASTQGDSLGADGLAPVTFYVPSADASGFLKDLQAIGFSAAMANPLAQQILNTGMITDVGGKTFNIIPDSTLPPDEGKCYVRLNKPLGMVFAKPGLDEVLPATPDQIPLEWRTENKGKIMQRKPFGAYTPLPYAVRVLCIQYRTAGSAWRS